MRVTTSPFAETNALRAILNLVQEFILWIDEHGHIIDANQSVSHSLGYSIEEVKQLTIFEVNPHLNLLEWKKTWKNLSSEPSALQATEFINQSQELIPVNWRGLRMLSENGELCCLLGTSPQNTNPQTSPKILGKSEIKKLHLSRFTLDISKDIVLWVRPDATIEYINNAIEPLLGYLPEEALQLRIYDIDPSYNEDTFQQSWENLKSHKGSIFETQLKHKDGHLIPCEIGTNYLEYEGKEYNCAFIRDLRPQKQKTRALEEAMEQISQLSEQLEIENTSLKEEIAKRYNFNNIITKSDRYQRVLQRIGQVAQTEATVLLVGETGTGKELLARAIHQKSRRKDKPMINVNCAALPKDLVESELFGHEKGAFTGAYQQKKGRFELANGGTLFLDEIGELPLELQPKLLRVLQEGVFERVGATESIKVNVRIVAATNRHLDKMVDQGTFREDLYYRLNVFPIENLPLRERKEDIPLLVHHFVNKYSSKAGKKIEELPAAAMKRLMKYEFPGNVRELENIVERAVILSTGKVLNLSDSLTARKKTKKRGKGEFPSFEDVQRQHIVKALERTNWRITGPKGAGKLLKMNDRTLMSKMRKLGIKREGGR
jgi:PAS domain S-box-containing protein